jgi:hypothetical protein
MGEKIIGIKEPRFARVESTVLFGQIVT